MNKYSLVFLLALSFNAQDTIAGAPEELKDNVDEFFEEFENLEREADSQYKEHEYYEDMEITSTTETTVTKQPKFFADNGVVPENILELVDFSMDPHTEIFVDKVWSSKRNENLRVYATKSDKYCFIKLVGGSNFTRRFFFECELMAEDVEIFFLSLIHI